jgi:hypothetical protein
MKKNYNFKLNKISILLLLLSSSLFAQVNDENFDGLTPSLRGLDYTTNGIRFQQIAPNAISQMASLSEASTFIITPTSSDLGLLFNIDNSGTISGPNIGAFDYRIGSADGSEFKMVSMEADMSANPASNGYAFTATATGYRDGVSVVSDIIDFTISDNNGTITYAKDAIPAANGGTLTFSEAWSNIDDIRFTGGNSSSISLLMIDQLNFSPPNTLSIVDNTLASNITIFPNPTKDIVTIDFAVTTVSNIKVHNILGELVFEKDNIMDNKYSFQLNQPAGLYIISVITENEQLQLKLIKE